MNIQGRCHIFGDNVSTDDIIAGKYKNRILDIGELAAHIMENLDPAFFSNIAQGDFIVGGRNFGVGSSREAAPLVIRAAGIGAVLAKSFARIFYRNSFNIGLLLLECDTGRIEQGDIVSLDTENGVIFNTSQNLTIPFKALPPFVFNVLQEGGLVAHFKKHKGFDF